MKAFLQTVLGIFFHRRPLAMLGRSIGALALGILLLWRPEIARHILAALVWLPPLILALVGLRLFLTLKKERWVGLVLVFVALGVLIYLLTLGFSRLALWGAAAWALLAAAGLLWNSFSSSGKPVDWQIRVIGGIGGVLTGLAGILFIFRNNADFLQSSVLFGVFFVALALLTAAEASWQSRRR